MFRSLAIGAALAISLLVTGCASVSMAPAEQDVALKSFNKPAEGKAGVYIYRNTFVGQALKKTVSLDGQVVGETANKVYFYKEVTPGDHVLSTESEFSDNELKFTTIAGRNYFFEQYIKMGVFVGGANIRAVSEEEGKAGVSECKLAQGS